MSDDLITRWQRGDADAAHALVSEHYPALLNLFYRLTGTREQAEELTQELFMRLTRVVTRGERVDNPRAWLQHVGLNLWRDWVRREIAARKKGISGGREDEAAILRQPAPDAVEAEVIEHWLNDAVRLALLELSPDHREVIVLRFYQGLEYAEIAGLCGLPIGTVRSRLHYAVHHLRNQLMAADARRLRPWQGEKSKS